MAWQTPKTDWKAGDIPAASDFNRIEGDTLYLKDEVDSHKAEDASTTAKGHVQLNNTVTSTSTTQAATANAVKTVNDGAKAYTDAHEQKAAPHSGHETPSGAQAKVDAHSSQSAPHSGHATTSALSTHTSATSAHSATSAATANRIMRRDAAGRAKVAAPAAADDIARKDTVDAKFHGTTGHKHTGEAGQGPALPGWELIDETVLESDATSVSWSSLASHWKAFRIDFWALSNSNATHLLLRFNNDSGAVYDYQRGFFYTSSELTLNTGQTAIKLDNVLAKSTKNPQPMLNLQIGNLNSGYKPVCFVNTLTNTGTDEKLMGTAVVTGYWKNTSDSISRIDLVASSYRTKTGSIFRLWGLRA